MEYENTNYTEYAKFFAENILHTNADGENVYSALRYTQFLKDWNENLDLNINELKVFLEKCEENEKNSLTKERKKGEKTLQERGIYISYANLFFLCRYIIALNESWYLALLKPTVSQSLELINDIEKIEFINKDGSSVGTDLRGIINPIKSILKTLEDDSTYEVEDIVSVKEWSNKEIFQADFVYCLSRFLRNFFLQADRRKNAYISESEQQLVLDMLSYFGFAPKEGLTKMRYRQLMMYAKDVVESFSYFEIDGIEFPISFVKHEDWKDRKLSYIIKSDKEDRTKEERVRTNYNKVLNQLSVNDTIIFPQKVKEKLENIAKLSQKC